VLEPAALVSAAGAAGVRLLAISDHDSLAAYREIAGSARELAPSLELLAGVEINAVLPPAADSSEREVHVLGLGVDPTDERFEELLLDQRAKRRVRFDTAVARLREIGVPIDDQLVDLDRTRDDALGRPTLARALIAAGHATSVEDAFARLLGVGKRAYVPREGIGPEGAIRAISMAGGIPVLAHFDQAPHRRDIVRGLQEHGLAGLEVHYRRFDPVTIDALAVVAAEMGLLRTGGSDFHGDDETYAEAHARLWVPPEVGERLRATLAAR
jgi:predicted metal-dependent phosphoesterase TrpH